MAALRLRVPDRMELGIATALGACAIGISLLPDVFTVKDDIGRMNTVFKFYLQAWVLFGLASAYLLWRTWTALDWSPGSWGVRRAVAVTVFTGLLAAVLIYPVMGTHARLEQRFDTSFVTLDGSAYMKEAVYHLDGTALDLSHDRRAIRWMQANIEGSPVIIEGLTDLYRWGNRVSIYTGLPAVIGWDWHQRQQRVEYASTVTERRRDVQRFYSSPSAGSAEEVLLEYGVQYVYVGELERSQYAEAGIGKLRRMADDGLLEAVYDHEPVTIYRVNQAELAARAEEAPGDGAL
ncbi:MAG: DUF2298 domain-containing protein [Chloroflexota bacterium]